MRGKNKPTVAYYLFRHLSYESEQIHITVPQKFTMLCNVKCPCRLNVRVFIWICNILDAVLCNLCMLKCTLHHSSCNYTAGYCSLQYNCNLWIGVTHQEPLVLAWESAHTHELPRSTHSHWDSKTYSAEAASPDLVYCVTFCCWTRTMVPESAHTHRLSRLPFPVERTLLVGWTALLNFGIFLRDEKACTFNFTPMVDVTGCPSSFICICLRISWISVDLSALTSAVLVNPDEKDTSNCLSRS